MAKLAITLKKSKIGNKPKMNKTLIALGLRRINHCVIHDDIPQVRGMIQVVRHLVSVEVTK